MTSLGRYIGARLHRRLFLWFGATILLTGLVTFAVAAIRHQWNEQGLWERADQLRSFAGHRFADVWSEPKAREHLARSVSRDFDLGVVLLDPDRRPLSFHGRECRRPGVVVPVQTGEVTLGFVDICSPRGLRGPARAALFLLISGVVIWAASGLLARRIARPLEEVARVAGEIGAGKLHSRADVSRQSGEPRLLGEAINEMAGRIEKQISDQRELLASVSHELRTPLSRMRLLVELGRGGDPVEKIFDEIEREVAEVDGLVGELLANARLDFAAPERRALDGAEVALRALERASLSAELLQGDLGPLPFRGDPTLIARALANLLNNAQSHGGAPIALRVEARGGVLCFAVEDDGPGFGPEEEAKVFQPFYRGVKSDRGGSESGSLGLGLALVQRIAQAHGGKAWAENRPDGGARVTFSVSS